VADEQDDPTAEADEDGPTLRERQQRVIESILTQGGQLNAGSTLPFAGPGLRVFDANRPARAETAITDVCLRNDGANDETLLKLNVFPDLERLTLFGDTSVTDKGLAVVAELPELKNLQIQSERITDDGLQALMGATKTATPVDPG